MQVNDIITDVVDRVQDEQFTQAVILNLINEARYLIASQIDLPALRTRDDLTTTSSTSSVALPEDYHKGIYWVGSAAQGKRIGSRPGDYYNMLTFQEVFPVAEGLIECVCVDGANLLYRHKAEDTLTVRYYAKPAAITISDLTDEPVELPEHLQRPLLSSYCCREIYADIEDGMEGQKVNTAYWDKKFQKAMVDLAEFVRINTPREPKHMRDISCQE